MRKRIGCLTLALALCLTLLPSAALAAENGGAVVSAGEQADSPAEKVDAGQSGGTDEAEDEISGADSPLSIVSGPPSTEITKTYGEKFSLTFEFGVPDGELNGYITVTYKVGPISGTGKISGKQFIFTYSDTKVLSAGDYAFSFTAQYQDYTIQSDIYKIHIAKADTALQAQAAAEQGGAEAASFTYGDTFCMEGTVKRKDTATDGTAVTGLGESADRVSVFCGSKTLGTGEVSGEAFRIPVDTRELGAGTHTLTVQYAGSQNLNPAEAEVTVAVARKAVDPAVKVSGTYTYTGQPITPAFQVYDGETVIPDSEYTWEVTDHTEPGTGYIHIENKDGGNYILSSATQSFPIERAVYTGEKTMAVTVPDAAKDNNRLTLPELPQGARYAVKELSDAVKEGASGTQALFPADAVTWVDGNTLTFRTGKLEAGYSAAMTFSVTGAVYYQDYDVVVTVKVVERPQKPLAVSMDGWIYGGAPHGPEFTAPEGMLGAAEITYEKKGASGGYAEVTAPASTTDAGDYRVTVRCETSDEIFIGSRTFTITPRSIQGAAVTVPALTYTGAAQSIADNAAVVLDGTPLAKGTDFQFDGTFSADQAGTYQAQVRGTGNYSGHVDVVWQIAPKTVTASVTVNGGPFTYTGSEIRPEVTVKDGKTTIPDTEYTLTYSRNQNAGMGTVTVVDRENGNYTVSGQAQFEIKKADQPISAASLAAVYGEHGRRLTVTGAQGQLTYTVKPGSEEDIVGISADGVLTLKKAGTAVILVTAAETNNHKPSDTVEVTVTVAKASAFIKAADRSAYIGTAVPDLSSPRQGADYTVSGMTGGDQPEGITVSLAFVSQPDMSRAGTFVIRPSVAGADDRYDFTCEDGTLTVAPRPSSGGSGRTTYPVNAPAADHGTVTVSPKSAAKGDTVTITATPDKGYELDTITVKDANGSTLKLTGKGSGQYTFTMPAGRIEIEAVFVERGGTSGIFDDVPDDAYYYEAVRWAAEQGITGGIGGGLFGPDQPCTRGQIVTFLWRAAGSLAPKETASVPVDVLPGSYCADAVAWALENGIAMGLADGTFGVSQPCTRGQAVAFLFRAIAGDAVTLQELVSGYADAGDVPGYALPAMNWALSSGTVQGSGGRLLPHHTCTRAQIVTFLYRAYQGKV